MSELRIPHYVKRLVSRLDGKTFHRETSDTEEAKKGGGFVFFTSSGRKLPPASCRFLIDNSLVDPLNDGLFDASSQSFKVSASDIEAKVGRATA